MGVGRDWAYAGWLTEVLGRAEQGGIEDLLILYADYDLPEKEGRRVASTSSLAGSGRLLELMRSPARLRAR
jgi:hypothetical protein